MGDLTNGVLAAPPLVKPGAFVHNLKLADKRAKWLSRRVFSDAERERSRELAKLKHHQQRVARCNVYFVFLLYSTSIYLVLFSLYFPD